MSDENFPLGRGRGMTDEELDEFLSTTRAFIKIGSLNSDGWPMVNPAWFTWEDGAFYLVTKEKAGFCKNLRRDPRVSILVDNPEIPYKRVIGRGIAEFLEVEWHERGRRMVERYLGSDGFGYYDATADLPRVTIRIRPTVMSTWNGGGIDRTFYEDTAWRDVR